MAKIDKTTKVASNPRKKPTAGHKKTSGRKTTKAKNPQTSSKRKRKSRNPYGLRVSELAVNSGVAFVSAVATRNLPQMLLKEKNAGLTGYLANAAVGAVIAFAASHFLGGGAAQAALIGSGVIITDRVITDKAAPVGKYLALSGIGDASAVSSMKGINRDLVYTVRDKNGRPMIHEAYSDAAVEKFRQLQPAQPLAGTRLNQSRFNRAA